MAQQELPLGIHFGLDAALHHADKGLGSSNIRQLYFDPTAYWFSSYMNQRRPRDKSTPQQERGTAMHKLLYEGKAKFDGLYMRGPDQDDMTTAEKTASTKDANKRAAAVNKVCLKAVDYDQISIAAAMITKNPKLATVFQDGFSEVTIVWERAGVRLKARLDYLKARGIGDLKAVANQHDIDFRQACRNAISNYRYDLQSAHYLEARALVPKMVADGMVYGDHDAVLLKKIATSSEYGWQWIFYQAEGAPITWSKILSPERMDPKTGEVKMGNPMLDNARNHIEQAIVKFKDFRERFGETMWLLIEDPSELYMAEMPAWFARNAPEV